MSRKSNQPEVVEPEVVVDPEVVVEEPTVVVEVPVEPTPEPEPDPEPVTTLSPLGKFFLSKRGGYLYQCTKLNENGTCRLEWAGESKLFNYWRDVTVTSLSTRYTEAEAPKFTPLVGREAKKAAKQEVKPVEPEAIEATDWPKPVEATTPAE